MDGFLMFLLLCCTTFMPTSSVEVDLTPREIIAKFIKDNEWREANIFSSESIIERGRLSRTLHRKNIKHKSVDRISDCNPKISSGVACVINTLDEESLREAIKSASDLPVRSTVIVASKSLPRDRIDALMQSLLKISINQFLIYLNESEMDVFSVVSTPRFRSPLVTPAPMNQDSLKMIESYNFEGASATAMSLSFDPYITISNSNRAGRECTSTGIFDAVIKKAAETINLTLESTTHTGGAWGVVVRPNQTDIPGVMGSIISDEADLCNAPFISTVDRIPILDMVAVMAAPYTFAYVPRQSGRVKLSFDFAGFEEEKILSSIYHFTA